MTFIGTVSPAGGNLKEPVTESTKKAARCFYALSQNRADSKRYPAIDTLDSYSKYLEYPEFIEYSKEKLDENWVELVNEARNILVRGKETEEQINILGDDSVPIDYHITLWKSEFVDFVILQQDAFDKIDATTSLERQEYMLKKVIKVTRSNFRFESFDEVATYFKRLINAFRQLNYTVFKSEEFHKTEEEANVILEERIIK